MRTVVSSKRCSVAPPSIASSSASRRGLLFRPGFLTTPLPAARPGCRARPSARTDRAPNQLGSARPWRRSAVRIRLATADDGSAVDQVFAGMSSTSRRLRFLGPVDRLTTSMRRALLDVDSDRHVLLIAEVGPRRSPQAVGLARYVVDGPGRAEIAYEVVDAWQRHGIGTRLLQRLVTIARERGLDVLHGSVLEDNHASLALLRRVLPQLVLRSDTHVLEFSATLTAEPLTTDDLQPATWAA
jgi:ribosomal protein S18 acetylase RimI-like enzyme